MPKITIDNIEYNTEDLDRERQGATGQPAVSRSPNAKTAQRNRRVSDSAADLCRGAEGRD